MPGTVVDWLSGMVQPDGAAIARLPALDPDRGLVNAVVEAVRGSRNKFKFEPKHGLFIHDDCLPAGATYPYDFGFIPSTRGEDGDPLDVLILMDEPAFVGAVVPARLLGAIEAEQTEKDGITVRNDRLIAAAHKSHTYAEAKELSDLPPGLVTQIEQFFISFNEHKGKRFGVLGRVGARAAERLLTHPARSSND